MAGQLPAGAPEPSSAPASSATEQLAAPLLLRRSGSGGGATSRDDEADLDEGAGIVEAHRRIDASWSDPFLRTALVIVRNSRRSLMSQLKQLELRNREYAVAEVSDFVAEIGRDDRAQRIVAKAGSSAII
jgi:hypothetical protein